MRTKFTTAVLYKGFVYGLDEGILACLDHQDRDADLEGGRYQHARFCWR